MYINACVSVHIRKHSFTVYACIQYLACTMSVHTQCYYCSIVLGSPLNLDGGFIGLPSFTFTTTRSSTILHTQENHTTEQPRMLSCVKYTSSSPHPHPRPTFTLTLTLTLTLTAQHHLISFHDKHNYVLICSIQRVNNMHHWMQRVNTGYSLWGAPFSTVHTLQILLFVDFVLQTSQLLDTVTSHHQM